MEVEPDIKDLEINISDKDSIAILSDWLAVGNDMRSAMGLKEVTLEELLKFYNET